MAHEDARSQIYTIKADVPKGSVLGPILHNLYTADIQTTEDTTIATFANDTAVMASNKSQAEAAENLKEDYQYGQ